jgi:hypothetical protein
MLGFLVGTKPFVRRGAQFAGAGHPHVLDFAYEARLHESRAFDLAQLQIVDGRIFALQQSSCLGLVKVSAARSKSALTSSCNKRPLRRACSFRRSMVF